MTDPTRNLDLMLRVFQRLVWLDEALQARLHDRGWPDVGRAQSLVMINVAGGVTRPADIARQVGVSRQAVHVTIGQMVELGMLTLAPDMTDSRYKIVQLTAYGESMRHDAQAAMAEILGTLGERLGPDRLDALLDALRADWGKTT